MSVCGSRQEAGPLKAMFDRQFWACGWFVEKGNPVTDQPTAAGGDQSSWTHHGRLRPPAPRPVVLSFPPCSISRSTTTIFTVSKQQCKKNYATKLLQKLQFITEKWDYNANGIQLPLTISPLIKSFIQWNNWWKHTVHSHRVDILPYITLGCIVLKVL